MPKIESGYIDSMRPRTSDRQVGEPRRWMWWFGAPWLVLGAAAAWLKSERLIDVALFFLACAGVMAVVDGMRTGTIEGRWGERYDRVRDTGSFWSAAILYSLIAVAILVSLVLRYLGLS
jgi:hypothetical protein